MLLEGAAFQIKTRLFDTKSNIPGEGPTESNFPQETESFFEKKRFRRQGKLLSVGSRAEQRGSEFTTK